MIKYTEEDFYKFDLETKYDCLRALRIKHQLFYINVLDLKKLAENIDKGFRPISLQAIIISMNKKGKLKSEELDRLFVNKNGKIPSWYDKEIEKQADEYIRSKHK